MFLKCREGIRRPTKCVGHFNSDLLVGRNDGHGETRDKKGTGVVVEGLEGVWTEALGLESKEP